MHNYFLLNRTRKQFIKKIKFSNKILINQYLNYRLVSIQFKVF